jgi:DNA-directed RNA polymerase beta subunit
MDTLSPFANLPTDPAPPGRSFSDPVAAREAIYDRVKTAVSSAQPVKTQNYTLTFHDVDYEKADPFDHASRKQAILTGGTLERRLRGTIRMSDNVTGQPLSEKSITIAKVPVLTDAGTYVLNGVNYSLANQARLIPGTYVRRTEAGDVEGFVNPEQGKGRQHRYTIDPTTGVFKLKVDQSYTPLLPILEAMGADEKALTEAWGPELVAINRKASARASLPKLAARLIRKNLTPDQNPAQIIREAMEAMPLDPDTNNRTLGKPYANAGAEMALAATRKIISVLQNREDPDDRDAMPYQKVLGPEDLMAERASQVLKAMQPYLWRVNKAGDLSEIPPNFLGANINAAITRSGLGVGLEEPNPLDLTAQQTRISRMGYGGIANIDAVPLESRMIMPTQLGYIDSVFAPECYDDETEVMTSTGWKMWRDIDGSEDLACLIDGAVEYHRPSRVIHETYRGVMYGAKSKLLEYLVTPNHRMYVRPQDFPKGTNPVYRIESAEVVAAKSGARRFLTGGHVPAVHGQVSEFILPVVTARGVENQIYGNPPIGASLKNVTDPIDIGDWLEFLGWYLSEGSFDTTNGYNIKISQVESANPVNCDRIRCLLSKLPFAWSYSRACRAFTVGGKQLASYCEQFGFCDDKFVPSYVFNAPVEARRRFLGSILAGDGRKDGRHPGDSRGLSTSSKRLADDVQRLMFDLGIASRISFEPDDRKETYLGCYFVNMHRRQERAIYRKNASNPLGQHYTVDYDGMVHCAVVPGGLMYVRRNNCTGFWCGNSSRIGVDSRLAAAAWKGNDGKIYTPVIDVKAGKRTWASPDMLHRAVVALPNEMDDPDADGDIKVLRNGKLGTAFRDEVTHILPDMEGTMNPVTQLVPGKSGSKANRASMAARMLAQSLPLATPEAPFVQSLIPDTDESYEERYGTQVGAVRAASGGTVEDVSEGKVTVRQDDGTVKSYDLQINTPTNRKSVTGDTRVFVKKHDGQMWEGCIRDYAHSAGDRVLSVDPLTHRSAWLSITGFIAHTNDKKLVRICTNSGRHVDVTVDHSLVTIGDDGKLQPIFPMDCVIGRTRLPIAMLVVPDEGSPRSKFDTRDFGRLCGLYLAEGWLSKVQKMTFIAVQPDDRAEQIMKLCCSLGLNSHRNGGAVTFTDHEIYEWLLSNFGTGSGVKAIPATLLSWTREFREGLIEGYMAGDGCLWADGNGSIQVVGVSTSIQLRDSLVAILSSLNVFATLFDAPRQHISEKWNDAYGFRVISRHLSRLSRWFFYDDRQSYFAGMLKEKYMTSVFEAVPVTSRGRKLTLYPGIGKRSPDFIVKTAAQGFVAKHRLEDCGCGGPYGLWATSDVMWAKIESITPIEHQETVYDFSVADSEVFAVNGGLVVHNTRLHNTATVKPGDRIEKNGLLATSNFTDKEGRVALGANLRVAYIPYKGHSFEDALVVSESAAKKLTSDHLYQHDVDFTDETRKGKSAFTSLFPSTYTRDIIETMDDDGVVKPGTTVTYGHPLVLKAQAVDRGHQRIARGRHAGFSDASVTWDHHDEGVVTDVAHTKTGVNVVVVSKRPFRAGDKLSGRHGDKGVTAQVIPDDEMPKDAQGRPFDALVNSLTVVTRLNSSQLAEAALGKIAEVTGKPYKLRDFAHNRDLTKYALEELKKHNIPEKEDVTDPETGRVIPNVFTGNRYFLRLHHLGEDKLQGRGLGSYSADDSPARTGGAEGSSKRVALMDVAALMSHGAYNMLRDVKEIRSQRQADYWADLMSGKNPRSPRVSAHHERFLTMLKAAGINPIRDGSKIRLTGMTDKDVDALAEDREIQSADTVDVNKGLKPVRGGLFDNGLTGGHAGTLWSKLTLAHPLPNPVYEEPIRKVLGLTEPKFRQILSGQEQLNGKTGPAAIYDALDKIDLDRDTANAESAWRKSKRVDKDSLVKKWWLLEHTKRQGLHPRDWMVTKVPVMPPKFRPITILGESKLPLSADANYLYGDLIRVNQGVQKLAQHTSDTGEESLALYDAYKALAGLGEPVTPKNRERKVKGILGGVFGSSPKYSTLQFKLLGSTVDTVGRGVIIPDPNLNMDEVGLPEDRAWTTYAPWIVRRLVRRGVEPIKAKQMVDNKDKMAKNALLEEMEVRPVTIVRAPTLHRYGSMAFFPKLMTGSAIRLTPIVAKGYGADHDGDQVNWHVPVSDAAVKDAIERMLPSKNLLSTKTFKSHYIPSNEFAGGIYQASTETSDSPPRTFKTVADVIRAFRNGDISHKDKIHILETHEDADRRERYEDDDDD